MDLPDEVVEIIISSMSAEDKVKFMAVCRRAASLTLQSAEVTLQLTQSTKFAVIRKVLDAFPAKIHLKIICPDELTEIQQPTYDSLSAVDMFMSMVPRTYMTEVASSCRWEGIANVTIQGTNLRCLLPEFIAAACPQLTRLTIITPGTSATKAEPAFTNKAADSQPLTLCSSLKQLEFQVTGRSSLALPPAHHFPAHLRLSLPNIHTLKMTKPSFELVGAYVRQLTRLEIQHGGKGVEDLICHCSNLQYFHSDSLILPYNPAKLKVLELPDYSCSENDYRQLLHLPNLDTLHLAGIVDVQQDWSNHACAWQVLQLRQVEFTSLAKLSLSNLKRLGLGHDAVIRLPDPSKPDCLRAIRIAVDSMSHVGQIVFEEANPNADVLVDGCGTIFWDVPYSHNDEATAALFRLVSQHIGPAKTCHIHNLLHSWLLLHAVVDWGRLFLRSVCLADNYPLSLHVWMELQQLLRLRNVAFWSKRNPDNIYEHLDPAVWDHNQPNLEGLQSMEFSDICDTVTSAANYYVIPTNRSLRIEYGVFYAASGEDPERKSRLDLLARIQEALPPGSKVSSVELHSMNEHECYKNPHKQCDADKFWVIEVEPSGLAA